MASTEPSPYKAVVQVAAPLDDRCERFDRGHHGHPVQVALAMKQAGDDRLFRPVRLADSLRGRASDQDVAMITVIADDDGAPIALLNHDPSVVEALAAIEDPFLVWEPKYGVLFVMTEQGREVMGTGSITCCPPEDFTSCRPLAPGRGHQD